VRGSVRAVGCTVCGTCACSDLQGKLAESLESFGVRLDLSFLTSPAGRISIMMHAVTLGSSNDAACSSESFSYPVDIGDRVLAYDKGWRASSFGSLSYKYGA
jgi:hypothetical protein